MQPQAELFLILIFGIAGSLTLVIGIIASILLSQKRFIKAQQERLTEIERREKEKERLVTELTELKATLERRVSERTEALEDSIRALKQTQAQLVHAEKMASLGNLVAGTAHEFNNPLTIISGNLKFLEDYFHALTGAVSSPKNANPNGVLLNEALQETGPVLKSVTHAITRLVNLVTRLRQFAHLDESVIAEVALHDELDNIIRLSIESRFPGILFEKNYAAQNRITCFAGDLVQVFMNLLLNAGESIEKKIKSASGAGGTIKITTKNLEGGMIAISIIDNGIGIAPDVHHRVFEPFFSTKPVGQGVGLSLASSYSIIKRHRGNLHFKSDDSQTEFIVEIPSLQQTAK